MDDHSFRDDGTRARGADDATGGHATIRPTPRRPTDGSCAIDGTPTSLEPALDAAPARARRRAVTIGVAAALVVGFLVALALDRTVYGLMPKHPDWVREPYMEMFRTVGYFPTWVLVGLALLLADVRRLAGARRRVITRRFELLLWTPMLAGILAWLLKILIRRERPEYHDGAYAFRSFAERTFNEGGLGLPSSHVATGCAALFILSRLVPAATPIWIFLGLGCAWSRLDNGAHFLSDVYGGAVLGCLAGLFVWRTHLRLTRRAEATLAGSA